MTMQASLISIPYPSLGGNCVIKFNSKVQAYIQSKCSRVCEGRVLGVRADPHLGLTQPTLTNARTTSSAVQ